MADKARGGRRRAATRPPRAGASALLGAASLGGALALTGILVIGTRVEPSPIPAPAAVIAAVPPPSVPPVVPVSGAPAAPPGLTEAGRRDVELVGTPKAVAFLEAMRAAGIPTSRTGVAEVLVAREACTELATGTSEAELAGRIPRGLPTVTRAQAGELVDLAQKHYC
ncbi:MAG: DUF732 domain-containing protein [Pseudonocardia sp.]